MNFSIYSLISKRISASSESKSSRAKILANCVFPTPVCPIKIKEPIGRFGSFNPVRLRLIALTIFCTASSCPITFCWITFSNEESLVISDCSIRVIGTPLIMETTWAISSKPTSLRFRKDSFSHNCFSASNCSLSLRSISR